MGVKLVSASGGSVEINPPATASNFVATMPAGTGTVSVNGVSSNIVSGTSQASTSGTSIDFTGIPSWVKRITVMFSGVSTSGTSNPQLQIGAGSIETTGYSGLAWNNASGATGMSSTGFSIFSANASTNLFGTAVFTLMGSNLWVVSMSFSAPSVTTFFSTNGAKTTAGTLDRVRITTVNGTDTFDAGSINILYE